MAELQAAWYGMRELSGVGARGDSYSVIQWMRSDKCPWKYLDMIDEIRAIIDECKFVVIQIPRSANEGADLLAKGVDCMRLEL